MTKLYTRCLPSCGQTICIRFSYSFVQQGLVPCPFIPSKMVSTISTYSLLYFISLPCFESGHSLVFQRSDLLSFNNSISCFVHTIHNATLLSSFSFAMRLLFLSSGVPSLLLNCTLVSSLVPYSQIKAVRPSGLTPISSTKPDLFTLKPMIPSSAVPGCLLLLPTQPNV